MEKCLLKNVNFTQQKVRLLYMMLIIYSILMSHKYATAENALKAFTGYVNHPEIK